MALIGVVYLISISSLCALAPLIAPFPFDATNLSIGAIGPSLSEHLLGTDVLGRDLLSRILYGGRISLLVGILATLVSLTIGVSYGLISGYAGGWTDRIMMRIVEIIYSMPFIVFVILLTVLFGRSIFLIFIAIGAAEWLTMARIVRGQALALKVQEYVLASQILGQPPYRIIRKHLLPNMLGPIVVYTTLTVPNVMLLEAFVSFLGLGVQAPMASWGSLIKEGADAMEAYPWLLIFPSITFSFTLLSLNFLGDALRDAFDPKTAIREI
ncbi:MAG: Oligopeptide transport system permease protein OppC [Candidatus Moanabacter tarae]|uniref:Oligopeptide transport system permease protein OppC n=1 Tax=Candidatus Moanibacter tarae TaxID=2200854 RepID=A0A2Z4AFB3_9BACT|nr:MAG: Oligopeptide transport system permease protein OppC [Candidatus Moanabacter tarae]|tara:strand:- start:12622 stop:13428 length:807 start_codon:yes stop_codon:yes gene_type:complete